MEFHSYRKHGKSKSSQKLVTFLQGFVVTNWVCTIAHDQTTWIMNTKLVVLGNKPMSRCTAEIITCEPLKKRGGINAIHKKM